MVRGLVYTRMILAWALGSALDLVCMAHEGYINLTYDLNSSHLVHLIIHSHIST
jgi:hypothetical protein